VWAGITRHRTRAQATQDSARSLTTVASSDPLVDRADELQYELHQGPCVDAASIGGVHLLDNTRTDERWPQWAARAKELGIGSVLSAHLGTATQDLGGLNLYSDRPHAFGDDSVVQALDYAAYAGTALTFSHQITGMMSALQTRHGIGVAQGILVARYDLSVEQAFQVLVRLSRTNNMKLRDLADQVVDAERIPGHLTTGG
jgi:hypothetical protein